MVAENVHQADDKAMYEEIWWQAALARDGQFDGVFVLGVSSTGIYCRPSCPSRKPNRENVVFFPVPELAERMGFRACLRCRPNQHISDDPQVEMVRRICRYIGESPNGSPTLEELGANVNVSPSHLQRVFKRIMSITPRQYADAQRLSDLKTRLREGWSVTDAMYEAGYGSSSRLYEKASAQLGMTPSAYRRRGQHSQIVYAVVDCPLGQLLIAATERGICAVSLGDDGTSLEAELRREYPGAEFYYDHATLKEWVELILRHLSGKLPSLDLPLDIRATAFQRRVWEQLKSIPYGATRSYSEIAQEIGQPTAARSVANSCGSNPVPLLIPCHRVVRRDGSLGGYRRGVERKKALLDNERKHAAGEVTSRAN